MPVIITLNINQLQDYNIYYSGLQWHLIISLIVF